MLRPSLVFLFRAPGLPRVRAAAVFGFAAASCAVRWFRGSDASSRVLTDAAVDRLASLGVF